MEIECYDRLCKNEDWDVYREWIHIYYAWIVQHKQEKQPNRARKSGFDLSKIVIQDEELG